MLDIRLLVTDGLESVRESQRKRNASVELVDTTVAKYNDWKTSIIIFNIKFSPI